MNHIHIKLSELKHKLVLEDTGTAEDFAMSAMIGIIGNAFLRFLNGSQRNHVGGGMDLNLLHRQKLALLDTIENDGGDVADLEGLVAFIDAFQDMMVELTLWEPPVPVVHFTNGAETMCGAVDEDDAESIDFEDVTCTDCISAWSVVSGDD